MREKLSDWTRRELGLHVTAAHVQGGVASEEELVAGGAQERRPPEGSAEMESRLNESKAAASSSVASGEGRKEERSVSAKRKEGDLMILVILLHGRSDLGSHAPALMADEFWEEEERMGFLFYFIYRNLQGF